MNARFFLDTNIFVYACDRTTPAKARRAEALIIEAIGTGKGLISFQVVQEFMNLALRRFPKPMNAGEAGHYWMTVLNPLLSVHSSSTLYSEALRTYAHYRISWFDALIVAAAVQADCAVLYSEDFQDGQTFGQTRVKNPFA
jgi:predicted nucleic acid-binding protein